MRFPNPQKPMDTRPKSSARLAFNPHVAALPAYNAGMSVAKARALSGKDDIARLGSNENPLGCSPKVLEALASAAFEPWRYADPACTALREVLAGHVGVDAAEIVCGNGSEEMIAALSRAFLPPGSSVLTVVPSFGLHEIEPLALGAKVTKIAMTKDLDFDLAALEAELRKAPQIFFISSPWNPVGPALNGAALDRLIKAAAPTTLFVLDEAYFEFMDPGMPNGIEVLRAAGIPHVVLRSFSKAYGLAGLRVGFAVCSDTEIARVTAAAKTPFNVNAAAQLGAIAAIGDQAWMKNAVIEIRAERDRTRSELLKIGITAAPSQTNFLFFDCRMDAAEVAKGLLADGIIVKAWREKGYESFLRANTGRPPENDRLVASLKRVLKR
ncbi:MAG: aminotransferase class I/II-fold pyridoxal phosphate-dependent enzyme [Rhodospirillaceae bacterium]|nr:aminotransferase class I/II-fold pyridoxal phosphate-dependent enzyme [Rhodospirillaceae bacterium]